MDFATLNSSMAGIQLHGREFLEQMHSPVFAMKQNNEKIVWEGVECYHVCPFWAASSRNLGLSVQGIMGDWQINQNQSLAMECGCK